MDLKDVTAIQHANEEHGLTVVNQTVVAIATQLRMKPEKLVARTQACLPAVVEQQFYLTIAGDVAIKPETFAKVLRMFLGHQTLHAHDLEQRETSPNLFVSKFDTVADFVVGVTELCNKEIRSVTGFQISFNSAAKLMLEYGSVQNVEAMIDSILADMDEICEKLKIKNNDPAVIMTKVINFLTNKIISRCHLKGASVPMRFMDYFEKHSDDDYILEEEKD